MSQPIKVLIVDDQILFATSLGLVLNHVSHGKIQVIGTVFGGRQCLGFLRDNQPDIILMDVRMPEMDGLETCKTVLELYPGIRILMLTTFDDDEYASSALASGATGYVIKNIAPEELIVFLEAVHNGTMIISPTIGQKIFLRSMENHASPEEDSGYSKKLNYIRTRFPDLKNREAEVLYLLVKGMSNNQIANTLFIGEQTVRNYISSVYAKIGADDRHHAIQILSDSSP